MAIRLWRLLLLIGLRGRYNMQDKIRKLVQGMMEGEKSGHGMDHVNRVYELALKFAEAEGADKEIVGIAALLHDVDDYKIVGKEEAEKLTNAREIMDEVGVSPEIQLAVLDILQNMGYSKCLIGIRPVSLEGKIVSDSDMCDAIGANSIIRFVMYSLSDKGNGRIFDRNVFPNINLSYEEYNSVGVTHETDGVINHCFEKALKLPNLMMTNSGREEGIKRKNLMVDFLRQIFIEENAPEWIEFLDDYLRAL